ncbi:hypothetical protein [Flavobacterium aquiphilum]|uniref:hypothetical protein n=1 Tax=Flavobacterium aquiphilum TaxID=3003261 RepID=UPI00247FE0EA|nr:hypothetical protein [Flavobacterium aquiphilum]
MRTLKNIILISFFIINYNIYSQHKIENSSNFDLSTSLKSFEVLSNLLAKKDTINLRKVVTKEVFQGFNFKELNGLQKLGEEWKTRKVSVYSSTEFLEVVKVEDYYIMLDFAREPNSNEWKFSTFHMP